MGQRRRSSIVNSDCAQYASENLQACELFCVGDEPDDVVKHGVYFIALFSKCRSSAHVTYSIAVTIIVFVAFVLYIWSIVADQKMSVNSRPHVFEVSLMGHM